jgi:cytochrome P450
VINYLRKKEVKLYNAFIETSVDKRIESHKSNPSQEAKDMFYFLLTAIDPDTGRPAFEGRNRLLSESRVLTLAGTDTTASSICGLFFYLSRYPAVTARLTSEIRDTFDSNKEIAPGPKLSQCKYLRACIDETLRLAHPAPGDLPREVLPGGAVIDGFPCPPGTSVGCSAWSMGRIETLYGADADVFRPERWMPSDDTHVLKMRRCFHPFSIGPMNCVGQNLAILEFQLIVAKTVWATDFSVPEIELHKEASGRQVNPVYNVTDAYLSLKVGPFLRFRNRVG